MRHGRKKEIPSPGLHYYIGSARLQENKMMMMHVTKALGRKLTAGISLSHEKNMVTRTYCF